MIFTKRIMLQHAVANTRPVTVEEWQKIQDESGQALVDAISSGYKIIHTSVFSSSILCATEYILTKETDEKRKD